MRAIMVNPYPGSRAFTRDDQAFFSGRDPDIAIGVDLWKSGRLTIISGPPGSGKTSLLHAGLYPELAEETGEPAGGPSILPPGNLTGGTDFPVPALAEHNPFTLALLRSWAASPRSWEPEGIPAPLAGLSVSDWLRDRTRGHDGTLYAAIDAVDELILSPRADEAWRKWRGDFLAELAQAVEDFPRLHLLLVTRDEALVLLSGTVGVGARHAIGGLPPRAAFDAITRPARHAGRAFSEAAASGVIGELSAGDQVEPCLLQVTCAGLWQRPGAGAREISAETVGGPDGVDDLLADWCGREIAEAAALHGVRARDVLDRLVSRRTPQPDAVAEALLDRHLLTREKDKYRLLSGRLADPLNSVKTGAAPALPAAAYLRSSGLALARGELSLARAQAERARALRPEDTLRDAGGFRERAVAESLLGNVAYRDGEPRRSLPHYRKASELMSTAGDSRSGAYQLAATGQILLADGQPGEAISLLTSAAARERHDPGLQVQLAEALWRTGDSTTALSILDSLLLVDGGHSRARRVRDAILAAPGKSGPRRPGKTAARGLDYAGRSRPRS